MTEERYQTLQNLITNEAVELLKYGECSELIDLREQAIRLIGAIGKLSEEETAQRLNRIRQAKDIVDGREEGALEELPEAPHDLTGLETLQCLVSLFEMAVLIDQEAERVLLYQTAISLLETNNFQDRIELTADEKLAMFA